jgi:hypothetical protein
VVCGLNPGRNFIVVTFSLFTPQSYLIKWYGCF